MPSNVPRQYAISVTGTAAAGDGGSVSFGAVFGFDAQQLIIANDGAYSLYLSLNSTGGSTGGFEVRALEAYALDSVRTYGFSVTTTTTSTAEGYRVGAWAW